MSSITINGNTIKPSREAGIDWSLVSTSPSGFKSEKDASQSNFVIILGHQILSVDEKLRLEEEQVSIQEYVSENTYLCRYEPSNLQVLRALPFVKKAEVQVFLYHPELKTTVSLKDLVETEHDRTEYEVDLILHENPNVSPAELAPYVSQAAGVSTEDMEVLDRKIRLTVSQEKLPALAALDSINRIEEVRENDVLNDQARAILFETTSRADVSLSDTAYQGAGQLVCVTDSGFDQGIMTDSADVKVHPAFLDRIESIVGMIPNVSPADPIGHGTHVCASICGSGMYKNKADSEGVLIQGTAPRVKVLIQAICKPFADGKNYTLKSPSELSTLFSAAHALGARIHNLSWGKSWDSKTGQLGYDESGYSLDSYVCENPDYSIFIAAGNDGRAVRAGKSQIGGKAAAKNCITVGAIGTTRDNDGQVYKPGFKGGATTTSVSRISSRGPTLSSTSSTGETIIGRIKPDVVAPGVAVLSAASRALAPDNDARLRFGKSGDQDWIFMSGTSMSTPLVAGCAAVLREALQHAGKQHPSAALVKALLINGAVNDQRQRDGPAFDYDAGFGRVRIASSLSMVKQTSFVDGCGGRLENTPQDGPCLQALPDSVRTWQSPELQIPSGRNVLVATLTYPDPAARGGMLQNNVNLIVRAGGKERHGNMVGDDQGFDQTNNVEKIIWEDVPGPTAVIIAYADAFTQLRAVQSFALAWDICSIEGAR